MSYDNDDHLRDVVDILTHSAHERLEYEEAGETKSKLEMDPELLFWGTRMVNTNKLGEAVVAFKRLEEKAEECKNFMTSKRAEIAEKYLRSMFKQYKYGVVSKSSETVRDKHNNQASMMHLLRKQSVEHEFNSKDEAGRKLLSSWLGKRDPEET